MNLKLFQEVSSKEALAIVVDEHDNVVWKSNKSPVSAMYKAYFNGEFANQKKLSIYANQAGIAMGILSGKISVVECYAVRMSAYGMDKFYEYGIPVYYEEKVPFVRSSKDENHICPIELYLIEHRNGQEQWDFLEDRFKGGTETGSSCTLN